MKTTCNSRSFLGVTLLCTLLLVACTTGSQLSTSPQSSSPLTSVSEPLTTSNSVTYGTATPTSNYIPTTTTAVPVSTMLTTVTSPPPTILGTIYGAYAGSAGSGASVLGVPINVSVNQIAQAVTSGLLLVWGGATVASDQYFQSIREGSSSGTLTQNTQLVSVSDSSSDIVSYGVSLAPITAGTFYEVQTSNPGNSNISFFPISLQTSTPASAGPILQAPAIGGLLYVTIEASGAGQQYFVNISVGSSSGSLTQQAALVSTTTSGEDVVSYDSATIPVPPGAFYQITEENSGSLSAAFYPMSIQQGQSVTVNGSVEQAPSTGGLLTVSGWATTTGDQYFQSIKVGPSPTQLTYATSTVSATDESGDLRSDGNVTLPIPPGYYYQVTSQNPGKSIAAFYPF